MYKSSVGPGYHLGVVFRGTNPCQFAQKVATNCFKAACMSTGNYRLCHRIQFAKWANMTYTVAMSAINGPNDFTAISR